MTSPQESAPNTSDPIPVSPHTGPRTLISASLPLDVAESRGPFPGEVIGTEDAFGPAERPRSRLNTSPTGDENEEKGGASPHAPRVIVTQTGTSPSSSTGTGPSYEGKKLSQMTKAERRALQEAQRAAKAERKGIAQEKEKEKEKKPTRVIEAPHPPPVTRQFDDKKQEAKKSRQTIVQRTRPQKQVPLFSHLPQYEHDASLSMSVSFSKSEVHSAVLRLGLKFAEGSIKGSNSRCIAMLTAFKRVIADYVTPPQAVLSRDLEARLKPNIQFLIECRPQSVGMGNAIKFLKLQIANLPPTLPDHQAKQTLYSVIDTFIEQRIVFAGRVITELAVEKIVSGDVILLYARSAAVERILMSAKKEGKDFRVVVVDARPLFDGKVLLRHLVACGIHATYIHIHGISYIMKEVTKVLLGAMAMLTNGCVVSRVGTATVASMANDYNIPVIVACETYKFTERVQLDSICFNELGNPDDLVTSDAPGSAASLSKWRDVPSLHLLHLVYDLTPMEFVSMVVTEVGVIPPTSVPVIIREYSKEG